jgi:hypothetical protein
MNQGALSVNDVGTIELLENMATSLNRAAESEGDGDRFLAYRRASLNCELMAIDLRQGLIWRIGTQPATPEPMPRYQAGERAYRAKGELR